MATQELFHDILRREMIQKDHVYAAQEMLLKNFFVNAENRCVSTDRRINTDRCAKNLLKSHVQSTRTFINYFQKCAKNFKK